MGDLSFWSEIFKTYGIGAIFGFLFMQIFKNILRHYMRTIDRKDEVIKNIVKDHAETVKGNTDALNNLAKTHLEVASTMRNICETVDRSSAQNAREHTEILKYCFGHAEPQRKTGANG